MRYLILALLLVGCTSNPAVVAGTGSSVILNSNSLSPNYVKVSELLPAADEFCRKKGKSARFNHRSSLDEWQFDCVN